MQSLFLLSGGVLLKKILCFTFSFMLLFNNFYYVYASDVSTCALIDIDTDKLQNMTPEELEPASLKVLELIWTAIDPVGAAFGESLKQTIEDILGTDNAMKKDAGGNVYVMPDTINQINTVLQDKVHALDGFYLIEPASQQSPEYRRTQYKMSDSQYSAFLNIIGNYTALVGNGAGCDVVDSEHIPFLYEYRDGSYRSCWIQFYSVKDKNSDYGHYAYWNSHYDDKYSFETSSASPFLGVPSGYDKSLTALATYVKTQIPALSYGQPYKIFYSETAVLNYLNQGRTYVPKLPSGGFKVNIKYINNTTSLPDITYNITTENKTETEIQNQYDTTINNYLNGLDDFTDGGGGTTNPTPTPSGGGSGGDFGDGTTPTPKPDFTDGSLTDTNTLLQKILDKLTEFSANHDKLAKTITDYIEKNDGKLDHIIEAINALSDGKTEDEKNGCKYDFTALSDFMTKLWNESDKKFDKMVELLEENNKYQKKLVNSLNEIKAILVTQTIMDVFQDRSQQTAEKAKDKFPTSLPWDIALVVNAMSAEPEKPQFNLPIQIKSLNINEEIHVDLASGEWEKLAKTCRYLLSILFILLMIQLSRKLFSNGGDD